jgi:CBS domain-containing protein
MSSRPIDYDEAQRLAFIADSLGLDFPNMTIDEVMIEMQRRDELGQVLHNKALRGLITESQLRAAGLLDEPGCRTEPHSKHPIIGHLTALDNALRQRDPVAARVALGLAAAATCQASIRMASAHEQFIAQVQTLGGRVEEAVAEANRIAVAGPSHEYARGVVLGRLARGEPVQQDIASKTIALVTAREYLQAGGRMLDDPLGPLMTPADIHDLDRGDE